MGFDLTKTSDETAMDPDRVADWKWALFLLLMIRIGLIVLAAATGSVWIVADEDRSGWVGAFRVWLLLIQVCTALGSPVVMFGLMRALGCRAVDLVISVPGSLFPWVGLMLMVGANAKAVKKLRGIGVRASIWEPLPWRVEDPREPSEG